MNIHSLILLMSLHMPLFTQLENFHIAREVRIDNCDPRGDFNEDGQINGADLFFLLVFWGTTSERFDLNGDGVVDGGDLGLFLLMWYECLIK